MREGNSEMKQAWERFFLYNETASRDPRVPEEIFASWLRCKAIGVPHNELKATSVSLQELNARCEKKKSIIDIITPYMIKLFEYVHSLEYIVAFADEDGVVLKSLCDDNVLKNFPERVATPGKIFSERSAGTNGIGTALYLDRSVFIHTSEHYNAGSHCFVCSGTPIHNPQGEAIGCLLVSCMEKDAHAFSLGMVTAVKESIEKQITIESYFQEQSSINKELFHALNYLPEGVIVTDLDFNVVYINDLCKEILGVKTQQLLGWELKQIFAMDIDLPALLDNGRDVSRQKVLVRTVTKEVECYLSASIYYNEDRVRSGYILQVSPAPFSNQLIKRRASSRAYFTFEHIIGKSSLVEQAREYARIAASSDSSVLILGESGTGKELFAQAIHNQSNRRNDPFIAINCGEIPANLIGSELFGYVGGAFTGAQKEGKPGKFELADGGTIFLDEIGEMPTDMQVTLLRVLQEQEFMPIGGKNPIRINVRVIAATNKDLSKAIANNQFRLDLFYRLNVFQLHLPPLRERKEDLPILTQFFIAKYNAKLDKGVYEIDGACLAEMHGYSWPGNIRELENVIERAVNLSNNGHISRIDLHPIAEPPTGVGPPPAAAQSKPLINRQRLTDLLTTYEGNASQVAKHLSITRKTLYNKLAKYQLDIDSYRV